MIYCFEFFIFQLFSNCMVETCYHKRSLASPITSSSTSCTLIPSSVKSRLFMASLDCVYVHSLPESAPLSCVLNTRQRLFYTRQRLCRVLHSAKNARRTVHRQQLLCRVLFVGHSTKTLPSAIWHSAKKSHRHGAK